ncbi:MAG: transposase, partial [Chloroflexia bacterium]|nr:transposase [Chloroflexia bacterium]
MYANDDRIWLYAFVIMPNHVHLIMRVKNPYALSFFQRDFLK